MTQIANNNKNNGKYVILEISCPACGNGNASRWYHARVLCGKHTEVNEYGYVRCKNNHGHPFVKWKWSCKYHRGEYHEPDESYVASALQCLLKGTADAETLRWYCALVQNVTQQFDS
eukprot:114254_1